MMFSIGSLLSVEKIMCQFLYLWYQGSPLKKNKNTFMNIKSEEKLLFFKLRVSKISFLKKYSELKN